jgi:hypothetical protein
MPHLNDADIQIRIADAKVSLPSGLTPWILSIKAAVGGRILANLKSNTGGMDRYLECAEINELPGAYLCCSFYQQDMNEVFTRMGIFMGAGRGVKEGTLLKHGDHVLTNYKKLVAGHNLPGPVVSRFYSALAKETDPQLAPNPFESAFQEKFLKYPEVAAHGKRFYVIGISIQNMKTYQCIVTHEIFHAKYFLDAAYQEVVNRFWQDSVAAADRARITETIGQAYNTDQEALVIDEFQAYLLQAGASHDRMKHFVDRYQTPLAKEIAARGIKLPHVER